ncbi:RNA-directed DNA polymerase [Microgenomates group bacterium]|nr:RNA-directed DNA polymerase [Microgenomates group bacterium]
MKRRFRPKKTVRCDSFADLTSIEALYEAFLLAKKGKSGKGAVIKLKNNLWANLGYLAEMLQTKRYRLRKENYEIFMVTEPKERVIMSLPFKDHLVQHALCFYLRPRLERHFVTANCANRNYKGTHYGIRLFRQHLAEGTRRYEQLYCLKMDIKGFFYNIDREILKSKLRRMIDDKDVWWLAEMILDATPDLVDPDTGLEKKGKGLAIGNLMSQFCAIFYLSDLDHFIKEQLQIRYYVRYMDDLVLVHPDKEYLRYCLMAIRDFVEAEKLELNNKTQIFRMSQGVDFLGWHFYIGGQGKIYQLLRKDSKVRRRRKNKEMMKAYARANTDREREEIAKQTKQSYASWLGHAKHGNTYRLRQKMSKELVLRGGGY